MSSSDKTFAPEIGHTIRANPYNVGNIMNPSNLANGRSPQRPAKPLAGEYFSINRSLLALSGLTLLLGMYFNPSCTKKNGADPADAGREGGAPETLLPHTSARTRSDVVSVGSWQPSRAKNKTAGGEELAAVAFPAIIHTYETFGQAIVSSFGNIVGAYNAFDGAADLCRRTLGQGGSGIVAGENEIADLRQSLLTSLEEIARQCMAAGSSLEIKFNDDPQRVFGLYGANEGRGLSDYEQLFLHLSKAGELCREVAKQYREAAPGLGVAFDGDQVSGMPGTLYDQLMQATTSQVLLEALRAVNSTLETQQSGLLELSLDLDAVVPQEIPWASSQVSRELFEVRGVAGMVPHALTNFVTGEAEMRNQRIESPDYHNFLMWTEYALFKQKKP